LNYNTKCIKDLVLKVILIISRLYIAFCMYSTNLIVFIIDNQDFTIKWYLIAEREHLLVTNITI